MDKKLVSDMLLEWAATWLEYPSGPFIDERSEYLEPGGRLRCLLCGGESDGAYAKVEHRSDCLHIHAVELRGGFRSSSVYSHGLEDKRAHQV